MWRNSQAQFRASKTVRLLYYFTTAITGDQNIFNCKYRNDSIFILVLRNGLLKYSIALFPYMSLQTIYTEKFIKIYPNDGTYMRLSRNYWNDTEAYLNLILSSSLQLCQKKTRFEGDVTELQLQCAPYMGVLFH